MIFYSPLFGYFQDASIGLLTATISSQIASDNVEQSSKSSFAQQTRPHYSIPVNNTARRSTNTTTRTHNDNISSKLPIGNSQKTMNSETIGKYKGQSTTRRVPRKKFIQIPNRTVPCPPHFKQLFLWDAVNDPVASSWFNVTDLHEATTEEETKELQLAQMNKNRIFYLTSGSVQRHLKRYVDDTLRNITSDQFEYPNPFNKQALDLLFDVTAARAKNRKMAVFKNARVTGDGLIMNDASVCQAVRNGGGNASMASTLSYLSYQQERVPLENRYSRLITLANFAQGSWHFPMELMVALANVDHHIIAKSKIHVKSAKDKAPWLNLLGIGVKQVVVGDRDTVMAETVYAPQMAEYSKPSTSQLYWLREKVFEKLKLGGVHAGSHKVKRSLVLIQRKNGDDKRRLADFAVIRDCLKEVADLLGYDFIVHQKYDQFDQQFHRFVHAAIVVAPHGAASLFINFAPVDLCFIELLSLDEPLCYAEMAYLRGQDYFGIPRTQTHPRKANMRLLSTAIKNCSLRTLPVYNPVISKVENILMRLENAGSESIGQ